VLLGAAPALDDVTQRTLVIAGSRDGVSRFSSFAALAHRHRQDGRHVFAAIRGASHHSFASGSASPAHAGLDLQPTITSDATLAEVTAIVADFAQSSSHASSSVAGALARAEAVASKLAAPIVEALTLEGSTALGKVWCNSDFPTNPTCNYPKYPDFSLPFGPAPAPSPPLPPDCICGSLWVEQRASSVVAGTSLQPFSVTTSDAFHDVSDEHPFHLPHIWNTCSTPKGCMLNTTTLTMPIVKAGPLFPNSSSAPLSAFEMKSKIKSRQATWEAINATAPSSVDKNMTICRGINQAAYDWALSHADADVRAAFDAEGEPFVMVDDQEAPIGITGPTWIKKELVYTRVSAGGKSHIEIQSWSFIVGVSPVKTKYIPDGMHYCKLLSPARAMEWIYTDGLRARATK